MKNSIISFIIFILTIACIIFSLNHLDVVYDDLSSICGSIQQDIDNDNWEKASSRCEALIKEWSSRGKFLSSFSSEEELHTINDRLISLQSYIDLQNKEEAKVYSNQISFFLNHIKKMQELNIENIF